MSIIRIVEKYIENILAIIRQHRKQVGTIDGKIWEMY